MSIVTYDPLDIAFLTETKMSVPSGHAAMRRFLESGGFRDHLTKALVEIEESRLIPECLNDTCDHDECPDPQGVGCGDAALIVEYMLHLRQ